MLHGYINVGNFNLVLTSTGVVLSLSSAAGGGTTKEDKTLGTRLSVRNGTCRAQGCALFRHASRVPAGLAETIVGQFPEKSRTFRQGATQRNRGQVAQPNGMTLS